MADNLVKARLLAIRREGGEHEEGVTRERTLGRRRGERTVVLERGKRWDLR